MAIKRAKASGALSEPGVSHAEREEGQEPNLGSEYAYSLLARLTQAIGSARTSEEALQTLYAILHARGGLRALSLEVIHDAATYFRPYGDTAALTAAANAAVTSRSAPESGWRVEVCALPCRFAPQGHLTFILSPASCLTEHLLSAAVAPLTLLLDQEALLQRVETSEVKAHQRISEVVTIHEIGQAIDQIELKPLLQMITYRAALLMDAQACSLMLTYDDQGVLKVEASHGLPEDALEQTQKIGEGIAGRVAQTEQPMLILDAARDPRLEGISLRPEIGSAMLVPMKNPEGRVLGVLSIRRRRPAPDFTNEDLKLFSVFATQAALALTNVRLYADLKRSANELLKLSTLSRVLISTLDMPELLNRVAHEIRNVVGFERCCLYLRDPHTNRFVPRVWRGYPDSIGRNPVREGEGAVGTAARARLMVAFDAREPVSPEDERERAYLQQKGFARALGADAFVAVPILTSQNRCIGVVVADNKGHREPISPEQRNLLAAFVNQAGIAIENARLVEEMQENYHNIHRLKSYTDSVLKSIGAGILSTDQSGQLARWNRAAEETLQLSSPAFQGVTLTEIIARMGLPDTEREHLYSMIQRVIETGERIHQHKLALHPQERAPMSLNLMISRLEDHSQERAGVVLIFEDVTQEVRLEAELDRMRRLADIGQLAAKMAHEVRNALSPIKGAAQIIRHDLEGQGDTTEWPDIIIAEVDGLSRLTSEMLDFARPTPLVLRPMSVPEFLTAAVHLLGEVLKENRVCVRWELPDDLPDLLGDPVQLGQVARNIIINAAQAMPEGGELTVSAEYLPQSEMLALRFRDTGVGIAPEEIERIFRPFVTTKTKGTGLGLPIVQKVVNHHGGRVSVESAPGAGTTFTALLPLLPPRDTGDIALEETPLISARPAGPFPDKQI